MLLRYGRGYGFEDNGELAGTVTIFPYQGVSFIGMLLIRRRMEGQGWGRRLLEFALRDAGSTAEALFATAFGLPLYKKMGFVEGESLMTHRGEWSGPDPVAGSVRMLSALSDQEREKVIEADARAFGVARPRVIDGLTSIATGIAIAEKSRNYSFAMARENGGVLHIGPVVADDDDTAFALVSAFAAKAQRECAIHVPAGKSVLRDRVSNAGLTFFRDTPMMTRGFVPPQGSSWYAVAMKATG